MKKTLLILSIAMLAAGCTANNNLLSNGFFSQKCQRDVDGISPPSPTVITYGEKNKKKILQVKTKSKVEANTEFHLKLDTKNNSEYGANYDTAVVTVKGVLMKGAVTGSNADWIDASGTYAGLAANGYILVAGCVPENASLGEFYLFEVTVDNLGKLDPRAEVVN